MGKGATGGSDPMRARQPYEPPRTVPQPIADPESGQRFANGATALAVLTVASVAGSVAALGGFAWLARGKGRQVGELGYLALFGIVALALAILLQQIGPTLTTRGRIATLVILIFAAVAGPMGVVARLL